VPNGLYHVTSRGNGRARIFFSDRDRLRFLDRLGDHLDAAEVELLAFVLMDNHFHLLVRTPRANLSRFMQRLLTGYALYARYKHRRPGHQFQGRFKAKLVQDDQYLLPLTRYIHLNPVKVAACRRLGKAARRKMLARYRWSSYPGYAAGATDWDFVSYEVLTHYGQSATEARRHYRTYVEACLLEDDGPLAVAMAAIRHVIGNPRFVEAAERRLAGLRRGRPQDQDLDLPRPAVPLGQIDDAVAARFGVPAEALQAKGRHVGPARWVVMELACRLGGLTQRAVGEHYGQVTCAAVSLTRRKLRDAPRSVTQALNHLLVQLSAPSRPTRRGRKRKLKT